MNCRPMQSWYRDSTLTDSVCMGKSVRLLRRYTPPADLAPRS